MTTVLDRVAVDELVHGHDEPDWLRTHRRDAYTAFEALPMPSRTDEEWRRSDIRALKLDQFQPFEAADGPAPVDEPIEDAVAVLRQHGSHPGRVTLDPELSAKGVIFMPLNQAAREHPDLVRRHLFHAVSPDRDKLAALHAALFSGGTFLHVPDGVTIERPFVSQFWSSVGGAAVLPHTLVVAGRNSQFNHIDEFLSPSLERPGLMSGSAEIFAGEGSRVGYVAIQRWGRHAWQFADQQVVAERDATVRVVNVGLGGRFAKTRVEARLRGPGATAELKGLFFGSGDQFFDYHTLQSHAVGNTTSDLLFKGALQDTARSVYAGMIRIDEGARRSDAFQANRNLLLSRSANAYSIPMLEIHNNDVRCTHAATVAPVDPSHVFYLMSRGVPRSTAERMIVYGFFEEVIDRIPVEQARDLVERELVARLG